MRDPDRAPLGIWGRIGLEANPPEISKEIINMQKKGGRGRGEGGVCGESVCNGASFSGLGGRREGAAWWTGGGGGEWGWKSRNSRYGRRRGRSLAEGMRRDRIAGRARTKEDGVRRFLLWDGKRCDAKKDVSASERGVESLKRGFDAAGYDDCYAYVHRLQPAP